MDIEPTTTWPEPINARRDRLPMTRNIWIMVALISVGAWFQLYNMFYTGYIAPGLFQSGIFTATPVSFFGMAGLASFIASLFVGLFIGTIAFSNLADRFGRRAIFVCSLLWFSGATIMLAFQDSVAGLNFWHVVGGIGIGVELSTIDTYIAELTPKSARGKALALEEGLACFCMPTIALLAWLLGPTAPLGLAGWRSVVLVGALGVLPIWWLRRILPESPRWLAGRGRAGEAARSLEILGGTSIPPENARPPIPGSGEKVPFRLLFAREVRATFFVTALLWFLTSFVSFRLSSQIVTIYVSMFGIPLGEALRYNAILSISIFILPLILRFSIDRIGRRPLPMVGTAIGGLALIAMVFPHIDARLQLVTLAIIGQIGISIGSMVLWPYTAETYATRIRSLVLGTSSSLARAASMLAPLFVGGVLQTRESATPVFVVFGLVSFVVGMLWLFGVKETAGRKMAD